MVHWGEQATILIHLMVVQVAIELLVLRSLEVSSAMHGMRIARSFFRIGIKYRSASATGWLLSIIRWSEELTGWNDITIVAVHLLVAILTIT